MKNKAFSLAEVLLTLTIIGVVASISIQNLQLNIQKQDSIIGVKKFYAVYNQALAQIAADSGCIGDLKCTGLFTGVYEVFGNAFVKYFNVQKNCYTSITDNCWSPVTRGNYDGTGTSYFVNNLAVYKFTTADGMSVAMQPLSCGDFYNASGGAVKKYCGDIYVDINGIKGPNYLGRDVFAFMISNDRSPHLYPYGGVDFKLTTGGAQSYYWNANANNLSCDTTNKGGYTCAGRLMEEGWQMNY